MGRALGSSNGSGSLNLRNLGSDATLVLLNGRRVARDAVTVGNVDVNSLVPQIAIERIDMLKDGASSLYGSDAVGGVANFLTRRNFDGLRSAGQGDSATTATPSTIASPALWGSQDEKSGVMVAVEHFNRDPVHLGNLRDLRKRRGIDGAFRQAGWPCATPFPIATPRAPSPAPRPTIADPPARPSRRRPTPPAIRSRDWA